MSRILILIVCLVKAFCESADFSLKFEEVTILSYKIEFNNFRNFKNDKYEYLYLEGKLCLASSLSDFKNNCNEKYKDYNNQWVLLINKTEFLNEIVDSFRNGTNKLSKNVNSIMFDNQTINANLTISEIPVFSVKNYYFDTIAEYTVQKETTNYFIKIIYSKPSLALNAYLIYYSLALNIILVWFFFYWYSKVFNREESNQLQKTLTLFPTLRMFIAIVTTLFIVVENQNLNKENVNLNVSLYLEMCIQTFTYLYRTFFWFITLLICYGWQVYRSDLSQNELKRFLIVYILIYFLTYFDQLIDELIVVNIQVTPSEIKNICLFILLTTVSLIIAKKSFIFLLVKYYYARQFLPDYCEAIFHKVKLLVKLMLLLVFYTLSYTMLILYLRIYSTSTKLIHNFCSVAHETIIMIIFLWIFLPRGFLVPYDVLFENRDGENFEARNINVFNVLLPSNESLRDSKKFNKDINMNSDYESSEEKPIVIVNPMFSEKFTIDKVSFAFKN